MEAAAALNMDGEKNDAVPKKQFLKRKKPAYVPPPKPATKQYKYYSDAIRRSKDGAPVDESNPFGENGFGGNSGATRSGNNRRPLV